MPFVLRAKVGHRVGVSEFIKRQAKILLTSLADVRIRNIETLVLPAFIVGCGHSGTTLLASRLGQSSGILLIPKETSLFLPWRSLHRSSREIEEWLMRAQDQGKSVLLEKTPKHIHCVNRIKRLLPNCRFIGITRNPLDNVASLYERFGDLEFCIERYVIDNKALIGAQKRYNMMILKYETLSEEPETTLSRTLDFIGLQWDSSILEQTAHTYSTSKSLKNNQKLRYEQIAQPIQPRTGRFRDVLDSKQISQVRERTQKIAYALGYENDIES